MNDETILGLGGFCQELLSSEAFDALCKLYSQQCAFDILNTAPHATKEREGIYASYQGFEGFLALTKKYARDYEKIIEQQNAAETTPVDYDDPSVHDIYRNDLN
jgi:hypothetical protein